MRYGRYVIPVFCLIVLSFCAVIIYAQSNPVIKPDGAGLVPELNRWRTAIGLRPLMVDDRQSMASQFHTDDMAARKFFAHIAPSGVSCNGTMVTEPPQRAYCFDRIGRGEDLAGGNPTAAEAVRGLIAHYPHCVDILKPIFTVAGGGNTDKIWALTFDGDVQPEVSVNIQSFCGCTSDNASEENLQGCVAKHNNEFNNGQTPPILPMLPLQYQLRYPADRTASYGHQNGQKAEYLGRFHKGTLTLKVVPVSGNPSGVLLKLADKQFKEIPGLMGTDNLTYEVTGFIELSFWFDLSKVTPGDTFYIEAFWQPADVIAAQNSAATSIDPTPAEVTPIELTPDNTASSTCSQAGTGAEMAFSITNNTAESVTLRWLDFDCQEILYTTISAGQSHDQGTFDGHEWVVRNALGDAILEFTASQDTTAINVEGSAAPGTTSENSAVCHFEVATAEEIIYAINESNSERCPQADTIFVNSDFQVSSAYEGSANAFPTITTPITISSMNREISRDPSAPAFRFFYVDGTNGNTGSLTLEDIKLKGGDAGAAMDGGAIFVDGRDGGNASLHTRNVDFTQNSGTGNGGAVMTLGMNGGKVDLSMQGGYIANNTGGYGGAIYSGGFENGSASAVLDSLNFEANTALIQGGAIYNNGLGENGSAVMDVANVILSGSVSPLGEVIHNNGRAGGNASLVVRDTVFINSTVNPTGGANIIFNEGATGLAIMTANGQNFGGAENVCLVNNNGNLESIACP